MATLRNVMHDGGIGQAVVNHYNLETAMALISNLATTLDQVITDTENNLSQQLQATAEDLQNKINDLQSQMDEVRTLAEILGEYEKGQVEQMIESALQTLLDKGLLNRLVVQVGDENVSLQDLILKTAYKEEFSGVDLVIDPETEEIQGIQYTVVNNDGTTRTEILNLSDTQDITDDNGNYLYTEETYTKDKWGGIDGVTAVKKIRYIKRAFNTAVKGRAISSTFRLYKGEDFIVFEIPLTTITFSETEEEAIKEAADVNQDGTVGPTDTQSDNTTS
jgi:hypothetical protein